MNYQKLDAALAMALNDIQDPEERYLTVFIHTNADTDTALLEHLGVNNMTDNQDVLTATLSPNAISQLSEQSWIQHLKLSQKLRSC